MCGELAAVPARTMRRSGRYKIPKGLYLSLTPPVERKLGRLKMTWCRTVKDKLAKINFEAQYVDKETIDRAQFLAFFSHRGRAGLSDNLNSSELLNLWLSSCAQRQVHKETVF